MFSTETLLRVRHEQRGGPLGQMKGWIAMFVETITAPREEWQDWADRVRLFSEPPEALVATVVWWERADQTG